MKVFAEGGPAMKRTILAAVAVALASSRPAAASDTFGASLLPSNVVPPPVQVVGGGNAPTVFGTGIALVTLDGTAISYSLWLSGDTPTGAALYVGLAGTRGAALANLSAPATGGFATGQTAVTPEVAADMVANPGNYYVEVTTAQLRFGAMRGALARSSALSEETYSVVLNGANVTPPPGSPTLGATARVTLSGTTLASQIVFSGVTGGVIDVTVADLHRGGAGASGAAVAGLGASAGGTLAFGSVTTISQALAAEIRTNPGDFYASVSTASYPGGAVRGQLSGAVRPPLVVPTVAKADGLGETHYVSDLRLVNPAGESASVLVEYFAAFSGGSVFPPASVHVTVPANGQYVVNDVLGALFGTSGSGALRITSDRPVAASSRVLNDQRSAGGGTFGVGVPAVRLADVPLSGSLPGLSEASATDAASGIGFRTNLGYFNSSGEAVSLHLAARRSDGTLLGEVDLAVPSYVRLQQPVFDMISTVPSTARAQTDFFVTYVATSPLAVYSVVVDNRTGDGVYQTGVAAR